MKAKELGIAVVGSGRIGTLRARLAAKHPAIRFLVVSDEKVENAKALADLTGADFYSTDNNEVIARPEVTAVFVSTPEGEHAAPNQLCFSLSVRAFLALCSHSATRSPRRVCAPGASHSRPVHPKTPFGQITAYDLIGVRRVKTQAVRCL
jgi:threonine dehydrogenase-like Zn-dependent dehydrogenase